MICYLLGKPERKEWELFPDINHRVIKLSQIEKVTFDRRKEMMVSKRLKGEPAEFGKNRTLRFSGHP